MSGAPPVSWSAVHTASESTLVLVDGRHLFEVPPVTTTTLLDCLAGGRPGRIIPGLLPPGQIHDWITHLLDPAAAFDIADADTIAEAVVEHITGVPATTACTLAAWLTSEWLLIDGYFTGRGVDLLALAPRRAIAAAYAFFVEHHFKTREEADQVLFPPRAPTGAELAADGAGFLAAMAAAEAAGG